MRLLVLLALASVVSAGRPRTKALGQARDAGVAGAEVGRPEDAGALASSAVADVTSSQGVPAAHSVKEVPERASQPSLLDHDVSDTKEEIHGHSAPDRPVVGSNGFTVDGNVDKGSAMQVNVASQKASDPNTIAVHVDLDLKIKLKPKRERCFGPSLVPTISWCTENLQAVFVCLDEDGDGLVALSFMTALLPLLPPMFNRPVFLPTCDLNKDGFLSESELGVFFNVVSQVNVAAGPMGIGAAIPGVIPYGNYGMMTPGYSSGLADTGTADHDAMPKK